MPILYRNSARERERDLMEEVKNRFVAIKANIDGAPTESDFEIKSETISLSVIGGEGEIIVKNLYVSVDPYQLNRMKSKSSSQSTSDFATAIAPGQVSFMFLSLSRTHKTQHDTTSVHFLPIFFVPSLV